MSKKKKKLKCKVSAKQLVALLKKHKKLKIVCRDANTHEISRERILTASGTSLVRYPSIKYRTLADGRLAMTRSGNYIVESMKFSRYRDSCYKENLKHQLKQIKQTMASLLIGAKAKEADEIKKSTHVILKAMQRDSAAQVVDAMMKHDTNYIVVSEVYVGNDYKKRLV